MQSPTSVHGAFRWLLVLLALTAGDRILADDLAPITVFWHESFTTVFPDVTRVFVFEDTICHAEVVGDHIRFEGMTRGDTLAFIWQGEKEITVVIHVVEKNDSGEVPSLQNRDDGQSNGVLTGNVQTSSEPGRGRQLLFSNQFDWNEQEGTNNLRLQAQAETDGLVQSNTGYNVRTASIQYRTGRGVLTLLDFNVDVSGGIRNQSTPLLTSSTILLRGASIQTKLGTGTLTVFAGATVPQSFLYYGGTRDVVGASWRSALSKRVNYSATAAFTSVPLRSASGEFTRIPSGYAIASLDAHPAKTLQLEAVGGVSDHGGLLQGAASYSAATVTAFGNVTYSATEFPLNQLQLLPAGHITASAGSSVLFTPKLSGTLFAQDTSTQIGPLLAVEGATQHLNPTLSYILTPKNRVTLSYILDRTTGTLLSADKSIGHRLDAEWSSQLLHPLDQTLRVTRGALSDPFDVNSGDSFSVRDAVNWQLRRQNRFKGLSFLFSYDQSNPSLGAKLLQDLALLSPALQQIYALDPAGFLQDQNLPPSLLNLINNLRPSSLSFEFDGQFSFGSRLNVAPTISYLRTIETVTARSYAPTVGFNVNYALSPRLTLRASLTNAFLSTGSLGGLQRTTIFSFGITQNLQGMAHWIRRVEGLRGTILGRVFRDSKEDGVFHPGESGFSGVRIVLSNGDETYTDAEGRYRFEKLPLGQYTVRIPISQFSKTVRLSTPAERNVDLRLVRTVQFDFGLIDFSRVQGSVYNDYLRAAIREPDAAGIADVRVILSNEKGKWEQVCDTSGEFSFDRLEPGTYRLSIDPVTIPDNYQTGKMISSDITVQSAHTATVDIPLVALRSIQGVVLHRVKGSNEPEPVAGVQVRAGDSSALTTKQGSFLLRDLPSGDLELTLVPVVSLPPGKKTPSGTIHLSRGPMEGRGVTIVISDDELLAYLVGAH